VNRSPRCEIRGRRVWVGKRYRRYYEREAIGRLSRFTAAVVTGFNSDAVGVCDVSWRLP
jgi:hypothetical protein